MIAPANNQGVPAGDWIAVGTNRRKALLLEIRHEDGEREILTLAELQRRFGHHDPERRPAWWGWIDGDGQEVRDLGDLALVNTVNGARVPLERAPGLLGCDVGHAGVSAIVGGPQSAPMPSARLVPQPATVAATVYTTRNGGPHIPGKPPHWTKRNLKRMPGARKVGRDWQITPENYERWLANEDAKRCASTTSKAKPMLDAYEVARRGLATLPVRKTKGGTDA